MRELDLPISIANCFLGESLPSCDPTAPGIWLFFRGESLRCNWRFFSRDARLAEVSSANMNTAMNLNITCCRKSMVSSSLGSAHMERLMSAHITIQIKTMPWQIKTAVGAVRHLGPLCGTKWGGFGTSGGPLVQTQNPYAVRDFRTACQVILEQLEVHRLPFLGDIVQWCA